MFASVCLLQFNIVHPFGWFRASFFEGIFMGNAEKQMKEVQTNENEECIIFQGKKQ